MVDPRRSMACPVPWVHLPTVKIARAEGPHGSCCSCTLASSEACRANQDEGGTPPSAAARV
jgi:hypothetical protein